MRVKEFYGAIVGDIVGSIYEFANIKTKDFPMFQRQSFATDDSIMTLAILQALVDMVRCNKFDSATDDEWRELFKQSMQDVGRPYPLCGYGNRFRKWMYSDDPQPYNSCGNGSAMRVSPVAWFARSLEECERLACLTAEPSHNHPDGIAGAQATAGAVYLALHGATKDEIKSYVEKYYKISFTLDEIRPNYVFDHFAATCAGTVPYAVEAFLESTDFEDCIRNTISIGGDSDTLAAISGAIAEAFYGVPTKYRGAVVGRLEPSLRSILTQLPVVDWMPDIPQDGLTPQEAAAFLRTHDNFLILTHIRPDGDTLGCAAALCRVLRGLGKTAAVLPNDRTSAGYARYMTGLWAEDGYEPDTVVTVDLSAPSMFTDNAEPYWDRVDLAIDHHIDGGMFSPRRCVYPERAACGEIIYEIAVALGQLTPEVALPLYVAVATDTGCFAFSNTTEETHRVAAELMATGIDYRSANKRHFRTKSKRRIAMEGELLSGLDFFNDDHVVFLTISRSMIDRLHLDEDDLDNVAALGSQIEGVDCAITLRQQENGEDWKASVRTTEWLNAAELCKVFAGGGHAEAAGCILHGMTLDGVKMAMSCAVCQLRELNRHKA